MDLLWIYCGFIVDLLCGFIVDLLWIYCGFIVEFYSVLIVGYEWLVAHRAGAAGRAQGGRGWSRTGRARLCTAGVVFSPC